jgi:hypothetical protein
MAVEPTLQGESRVLDKRSLRQAVAAMHARLGLEHELTVNGAHRAHQTPQLELTLEV